MKIYLSTMVDNYRVREYNKQKQEKEMGCLCVTGFWNEHCRKINIDQGRQV